MAKTNKSRRFSSGGPRPDGKEARRNQAKERNAEWAKLTPKQQLAALDQRFGEGKGASRQRKRLAAILDKPVPEKGHGGHGKRQPKEKGAEPIGQLISK